MIKKQTMLCVFLAGCLAYLGAQEQSVKPGINKNFKDPDVGRFINMFEDEDREIYAQRAEIVRALKLRPDMNVADIGAGTGFLTRLIATKVPQGSVTAVEISDEFLNHIEKTSKDEGLKNVRLHMGGERSSKLAAQSMDVILICDTFHHFEYPEDYARDIAKVLKKGGQLAIVDFVKKEGHSTEWVMDHVHSNQEQVVKIMESAGLTFERSEDFMKEQYMIVFSKK